MLLPTVKSVHDWLQALSSVVAKLTPRSRAAGPEPSSRSERATGNLGQPFQWLRAPERPFERLYAALLDVPERVGRTLTLLGRATGFFLLRDVYASVPVPARILFWVPTLGFMILIQKIVGAWVALILFLALFINFNLYIARQSDR